MGVNRVGQRIHVFWTDETAWFSGVVQQFSPSQGYYVVYDDGDERWEGLNESYRFDGQQSDSEEDDTYGNEEEDRAGHRPSGADEDPPMRGGTPRAMEPPASDDGEGDSETDDDCGEVDPSEGIAGDGGNATEEGYSNPSHGPVNAYPKPVVIRGEEDDEENVTNSEEDGDNDDDAQSMALSEVPITYEPRASAGQTVSNVGGRRGLPTRGVLRGVVVCARHLPLVNKREEPTAFARVAFVEAGSSGGVDGRCHPSTLMLRCKQTLSVTQQVAITSHPTWNDVGVDDDEPSIEPWDNADHFDGLFQLQVAPPMVVLAGASLPQPAWKQLKGDMLFSVYHQDPDPSRCSEFLGQASIPLHRLMRDLLGRISSTRYTEAMQQLPLESRQGKSIGGDAELVVRFQLEPVFPPDNRRPVTATLRHLTPEELRQPNSTRSTRTTTTHSVASPKTRPKSAVALGRSGPTGGKPSRSRPHQSSSEVNRRRFEKQLEHENKAQAKRMAEQRREAGAIAARRQQLNHQPPLVKSEPKPGIVAVKTAPPRPHKPSSAINRSKFVEQVKQENRSMGKRLIERAGLTRHAAANAKHQDELNWDDAKAQDKAHVLDKRRVGRQEKDFLLEKAQAKYQQQSELVEQVMTLQTEVADWKAKLFTVKSSLQRVDAMNTKDTHVRDCLGRAVDRNKRETPLPLSTTSSTYRLQQLLDQSEEEEDSDPVIQKHKSELRELFREAECLDSEQRRLDDQLSELGKRESSLESEILELHRKWQFVQAKRHFQTKMAADPAQPARAAYANRELRAKQQSLDISTEEEEQYAIYQAQEQLTQVQIAATVVRDRIDKLASGHGAAHLSGSSAACDYLREKIAKQKAKIELLETQQSDLRSQYEALVMDGEYEVLRAHAQELQHVLFLCQSEAKHVAAAERAAKPSQAKLAMELQKQRFGGRNETEILLKSTAGNASAPL